MTRENHHRRAFTRSELLALLVTLSIGAALALAATRQMRQEAMNASSLSQLRWLASATSSYAADNQDLFWSLSWTAGPLPHSDPTLPAEATTDLDAARIQAVHILRRLAGRSDIEVPTSWTPHILYNHLPLADYLARRLPDFKLVAPGDTHRSNWARDPEGFDAGAFLPFQPEPGEAAKRWPYSASYSAPAAMWDRSPVGSRTTQVGADTHATYIVYPDATLGGARLSEMAFPSQKVILHDSEQRELGAEPRYALSRDARAAALTGDGSAAIVQTDRANRGWDPNRPSAFQTTRVVYRPRPWEAQQPAGELVHGHYRWTRGGIKGRDFGGPEVDTGQP